MAARKERQRKLSGWGWPAGGMSHTQDANHIADNAIANDVGVRRDQFPLVGSRHDPATLWETYKAAASLDKTIRQLASRPRIKLLNINPDEPKMSQRRIRPNDFVQRGSGFGQGNSLVVPHDFSHSTTLSWVTNCPALISASAAASRRASSASSGSISKIDFILVSAMGTFP